MATFEQCQREYEARTPDDDSKAKDAWIEAVVSGDTELGFDDWVEAQEPDHDEPDYDEVDDKAEALMWGGMEGYNDSRL